MSAGCDGPTLMLANSIQFSFLYMGLIVVRINIRNEI